MKARATVIIPTFGEAKFARWAIKSVQNQTIKDIEICIICDGSPESMIDFFEGLAKEDPRITIFNFPKSARTGEPYRDIVIKQMTGEIICYCSHDDLWLPNHIEAMEATLKEYGFAHTIHAAINTSDKIIDKNTLFLAIHWVDLKKPVFLEKFINEQNFFGLTYGAHTKKMYNNLKEGWVTTPNKEIPTDYYMWKKFFSSCRELCTTITKITALNFPHPLRKDWSEQQREDELKLYYEKIQDPAFLKKLDELPLKNYENVIERMSKEIQLFENEIQLAREEVISSKRGWIESKEELILSKEELLSLKETIQNLELALNDKNREIDELTASIQYFKTIKHSFKLFIQCIIIRLLKIKRLRWLKNWFIDSNT